MNLHSEYVIRPIADTDCPEELTDLLHLSYKKLADQGFRFLATHQDTETTKKRVAAGECYVAVNDDRIIATITYYSPSNTHGNGWYDQPSVATFGQFAVHPEFQEQGIGSKLIGIAEELARRDGATELTVDTAEGATGLIQYYKKRGYRMVGHAQWDVTNYRSVMLSNAL